MHSTLTTQFPLSQLSADKKSLPNGCWLSNVNAVEQPVCHYKLIIQTNWQT